VTSTRSALRGAAAVVLVALLVGPSAQASAPAGPVPARAPTTPAVGHADNEWLMMGRNCGASIS
jgi:hypothetical protein